MPPQHELERIYDLHAPALFAFLLNLTRSEHDTRDLLQQLFVKLAQSGGLPSGVRDERGYLLGAVHHLGIDLFRRRESRERTADGAGRETALFTPAAAPDEAAFRAQLAAALGTLPPDQRAVLHLKLWEGLTFEQIAAALDLPLNTAASRYRYGLDKLRTQLRPLYNEINGGKTQPRTK